MTMNTDWLKPIWESRNQYRETFLMAEENGSCRAPFLFSPKEILKVESYDGLTRYEQGKDYMVEDGYLIRTESSSIPCTRWSTFEYNTSEEAMSALEASGSDIDFGPLELTNGKFLALEMVGHPELITKYMAAVTYTTEDMWNGICPQNSLDDLPHLKNKLTAREPVSILVYGDSISCGWDCSGMYGQEPNQPIWPEILHTQMERCWESPLTFNNTSVGGVDTEWAIRQVPERVTPYHPDLVVLGFGMNDRCPGDVFEEKMSRLIAKIREENPEADLVLVATTLPNPETRTAPLHFCAYQDEYSDALQNLCGDGIILADVQAVHKEIEKKKRYMDLTGNGINHPNDYLARVQVQVIAKVLGLAE